MLGTKPCLSVEDRGNQTGSGTSVCMPVAGALIWSVVVIEWEKWSAWSQHIHSVIRLFTRHRFSHTLGHRTHRFMQSYVHLCVVHRDGEHSSFCLDMTDSEHVQMERRKAHTHTHTPTKIGRKTCCSEPDTFKTSISFSQGSLHSLGRRKKKQNCLISLQNVQNHFFFGHL